MAHTSVHAAKALTATVDGQTVIGLADGDDAIMLERGSDVGEGIIGAGGDGIFSQSSDNSARITIKLLQTSPTNRLLTQKLKKQKNASSPASFGVYFKDRINGEGGEGQFWIQSAPSISKGKNATTREWVLWTAEWSEETPVRL